MLFCLPSKSRHISKHRKQNKARRAPTIEINANSDNGTYTWRSAAVSYDDTTNENVISRYLVTEILKKPIYPINEEKRHSYRTTKEIKGYTQLVWCMEHSRHVHSSEFFVSSDYKPRYDVVFGQREQKMDLTKAQ